MSNNSFAEIKQERLQYIHPFADADMEKGPVTPTRAYE